MNKRDVQEGCANGLFRVCTQSSNTGDENMDVLQLTMSLVSVYETGLEFRVLFRCAQSSCFEHKKVPYVNTPKETCLTGVR